MEISIIPCDNYLKHCPFCGGDGKIICLPKNDKDIIGEHYLVECDICNVSTRGNSSIEYARSLWNKRASENINNFR